jgi:hypothetical protein
MKYNKGDSMTTLVKTELHTKASKLLEDQVALELELMNSELSISELMKYEISTRNNTDNTEDKQEAGKEV